MFKSIIVASTIALASTSSYAEKVRGVEENSVVRIDVNGGHGSGAYLGEGIFITARHVTNGAKEVTIVAADGTRVGAVVIIEDAALDYAMVLDTAFASHAAHFTASPATCRTPSVGEKLITAGSPGEEDNMFIGMTVVGKPRKGGDFWKIVIPVEAAISGGISGGGVYDETGAIVGITVGAQTTIIGSHGTGDTKEPDISVTGVGYVVPMEPICAAAAALAKVTGKL